jgi:hypothetical protein
MEISRRGCANILWAPISYLHDIVLLEKDKLLRRAAGKTNIQGQLSSRSLCGMMTLSTSAQDHVSI